MAYLVLAYPELTSNDFDLIQNYRRDNDELFFKVVEPHFTIVFPVFDISQDEFTKEIKDKSSNLAKFDIVIRCATINKDAFNDYYHTFLVPDEGYSKIVKLHDKLYSDKLKNNLRLILILSLTLELETLRINIPARKWLTNGMEKSFQFWEK